MIKIGLTGGIASGKSTVLKYLTELGAKCIDADKIGHAVYKKGEPAHSKLIEAFGQSIVAADGEIDRRSLGPIVFADKQNMNTLCSIVWPEMKVLIEKEFQESLSRKEKVVVLEAAVLIEAGFLDIVDRVWVTSIDRKVAISRLSARNGLSEEEAIKRIDSQLTNQEREKYADVVFDTTGDYEITKNKVITEYNKLISN
ncbi:dephospho-CoA kinase [Heterostelium album PN500]|uniref:Dephospho-CoA kinase n=1 Tax=Heterostelium pallidum (strain ATCC 26659 / Pp 5 / PN500) TaxID=670386 RepID=D3BFH1_HETP5|nr:dephospho-CoA kinase [Heterostelium album PN500]EFA79885.1 dephospho-CoA kinase [Heterostelium album PN500]|eukprot:XP_020432006.1 dephospho-CoA kinase [Heterostelium album PN500]